MDGWFFRCAPDGWHWQYCSIAGTVVKNSDCAFASLLACFADATRNGYSLTTASFNLTLPFPE